MPCFVNHSALPPGIAKPKQQRVRLCRWGVATIIITHVWIGCELQIQYPRHGRQIVAMVRMAAACASAVRLPGLLTVSANCVDSHPRECTPGRERGIETEMVSHTHTHTHTHTQRERERAR
eukprot:COSAG03_NODE_741_length_6024_cov_14.646414_5_plen_120_part_01